MYTYFATTSADTCQANLRRYYLPISAPTWRNSSRGSVSPMLISAFDQRNKKGHSQNPGGPGLRSAAQIDETHLPGRLTRGHSRG
ncbi:hypothetical protein AVEN_109657-1 [Araneus ventricosus]|uniref:Uncharacterized protein n=1 Tax=Araneus ventricosus TaxID=182803 RepID=A0A4Y2G2G7_ARAVE|nr:hypothetical protein AVEN_109657-1 [Araneus ventricosus]